MRFALFYHSVISDWNHGNAHFLRGLMRALQARGHAAICYEPVDNWSLCNLLQQQPDAIADFVARFPDVRFVRYEVSAGWDRQLRDLLAETDVAIVHEWNDPSLVHRIGEICHELGIRSLFHDTHYRVTMDAAFRDQLGLGYYDAILAFSPSIAERFVGLGFSNVHVLHEAADITVFGPRERPKRDDVVFVGNYGDGDRGWELEQFVFAPRQELRNLTYAIYGVRYPSDVLDRLNDGIRTDYRGWIPNVDVPEVVASTRVMLHIPRRQYTELLPGTPTIRVFEVLACAGCLVSLPWPDTDHLFTAGKDYVVAATPGEMRDTIAWLCADDRAREEIGRHGRETILARHTCDHRASQLLELLR